METKCCLGLKGDGGGGGGSNELLFDHRNYETSKDQRFINKIKKKKKKEEKKSEEKTHSRTHTHTHTETHCHKEGGRGNILIACCSCDTQEWGGGGHINCLM